MQSKTLLFMVLLITQLVLAGCRFGRSAEPVPTPIPPPKVLVAGRETYAVQRGDVIVQVSFSGKVVYAKDQELFFERDGRIAELLVENGDFVTADTIIATLDIEELSISLEQAQLDEQIAQQKLDWAAADYEIELKLAEQNVDAMKAILNGRLAREDDRPGSIGSDALAVATRDYTKAKLDLLRLQRRSDLVLQKELSIARGQSTKLRRQIERSQIVAPFDGKVRLLRSLEEFGSQIVEAYEPVLAILDPASLQIQADPTTEQLGFLVENMPVSIKLSYQPLLPLTGTILALPYPIGSGSEPFVQIAVAEKDLPHLRADIVVELTAEVERSENTLWLPPQAISDIDGHTYVLWQEGQQSQEIEIQTGVRSPEQVEILAGLSEGQVVLKQ